MIVMEVMFDHLNLNDDQTYFVRQGQLEQLEKSFIR
jgi:hypothetical protein